MTARYREDLDPVLKDLSFRIPGGCSVGIVGRTGSGKSSLLLTLFRWCCILSKSYFTRFSQQAHRSSGRSNQGGRRRHQLDWHRWSEEAPGCHSSGSCPFWRYLPDECLDPAPKGLDLLGTLRSNLDPWNEQSDAKIWSVLREIKMDGVADDTKGLDTPIAECGSNLSVGQRQLLCLARCDRASFL